jgi:hypothetical protein
MLANSPKTPPLTKENMPEKIIVNIINKNPAVNDVNKEGVCSFSLFNFYLLSKYLLTI